MTILCLNISDIAIITIKDIDHCCIIQNISKPKAINLLENSVLEDRGYIQKCISKASILKIESLTIILRISQSKNNRD